MTHRKRGPVPKAPPSIDINLCCLAVGFHRWDCTKVEPRFRALGPYLPTNDRAPDSEK